MSEMLQIRNIDKSFTLHTQGAMEIPVFKGVEFTVNRGDCVALTGESGAGKSTLMRMIYANYVCNGGSLLLRHKGGWLDLATASPRDVLDARRYTMGYVSQFLRVIPRVPALEIVADPLIEAGTEVKEAKQKAQTLLQQLNIQPHLWGLSPLTFSGGEQQRVNIARGFCFPYPVLLLDEPTASLDAKNKAVVLELIEKARDDGAAIIGIFHDPEARERVCNATLDITGFQVASHG